MRDSIHVDHGLTGRNRDRSGLRDALMAVRAGDQFVVTKLDRLARSIPDARDIADELTAKGVTLNLGGRIYDPNDPVGKLLFNVLGTPGGLLCLSPKEGTDKAGFSFDVLFGELVNSQMCFTLMLQHADGCDRCNLGKDMTS